MSVFARASLEASPLADLHQVASELGIDGYRRLRKAELIDAVIVRAGGEAAEAEPVDVEPADADAEVDVEDRRPRRRRGGRGRGRAAEEREAAPQDEEDEEQAAVETEALPRGREARAPRRAADEHPAEGTVELLPNGSGFLRVAPPDPSDQDVYISAAQVRRCELVSGDIVAGPARAPRRSERYPSLIRVETINGVPADQVAEGTRYEDLPLAFPRERLSLGGEDPTVKAIEWLAPFGKGSRVTIVGAQAAGKTEALRRLAAALQDQEGLELSVVLAGVRPEEIAEWKAGPLPPVGATTFAASAEIQAQGVEHAVELGKRVAARGGDAVVVIDTLDGLEPAAARRAIAAARNLVDGGSLTVIGTASRPVGGETTVIALDRTLTSMHRFPALDLAGSATIRAELLVGEAGAEAIAKARVEAAAQAD